MEKVIQDKEAAIGVAAAKLFSIYGKENTMAENAFQILERPLTAILHREFKSTAIH